MAGNEADVTEEAIGWLLRREEAGAADWARLTAWLEADPAHARAYALASLADADAVATIDRLAPPRADAANDNAAIERRARRRSAGRFAGIAGAMAVIAALGASLLMARPAPYVVATGAGEHRVVALADGTRIDLNGDTMLRLDRHDLRFAALERGEATFSVRHDSAAPFELRVGATRIRDLGTTFDVVRAGAATTVAVARGAVMYDPEGAAVALKAGDRLDDADGPRPAVQSRTDPAAVGAWRSGRLVFQDAALADVAAAIARSTGIRIDVAPGIAARPFTGIVVIDADREALFRRLGALLAVAASRDGGVWHLASAPRASR